MQHYPSSLNCFRQLQIDTWCTLLYVTNDNRLRIHCLSQNKITTTVKTTCAWRTLLVHRQHSAQQQTSSYNYLVSIQNHIQTNTSTAHTHTHIRLTAFFSRTTWVSHGISELWHLVNYPLITVTACTFPMLWLSRSSKLLHEVRL